MCPAIVCVGGVPQLRVSVSLPDPLKPSAEWNVVEPEMLRVPVRLSGIVSVAVALVNVKVFAATGDPSTETVSVAVPPLDGNCE
jgi:hypothetical protein